MKKHFSLLIILFLTANTSFSQIKAKTDDGKIVILHENGTWHYEDLRIDKLEIPKSTGEIIHHKAFSLQYSEAHEQSLWVAYELTKEETNGNHKRSNSFKEDPSIVTKTASINDYKRSGYDRGHLAPAADMAWSEQSMYESFYFSNISPQKPGFNRGIWKKLESQVRSWAKEYQSIYVVTGPVLSDGLKTIGKNQVAVPSAFYKVVLWIDEQDQHNSQAVGFIIKNKKTKAAVKAFATTVDHVEQETGMDFFHSLPKNLEEKIERSLFFECWNWK